MIPEIIRERLSRISLLLMDVDGVLTDGMVRMDDEGVESKEFSTRDGFGLMYVRQFGLITGVISGRKSAATKMRAHDLKLDEVHLGAWNKLPVFDEILKRRNVGADQAAYVGDDLIDLPLMERCGVSAAPSDAHPEVLSRVDIVLLNPGGKGAVREFLDFWLMATGRWQQCLKDIANGNL